MYDIKEKIEAIRMVQKYLKEILEKEVSVFPSGIYDESTRKAVRYFQRKAHIEESGVVDYTTFTQLYDSYKRHIRSKESKNKIHIPLKRCDNDETMREINRTLIKLLDYYRIGHSIRESKYFTDSTLDGVKILKKIYQLDGDEIDEEFYLRIKEDEKAIE